MDSYDKSYLDIDELAKKIEERIKELELQEQEEKRKLAQEADYSNKEVEQSIQDLDEIIKQIDARIAEFEKEEKKENKLDLEDLTNKINKKLESLDDVVEEDLGKTLFDLSEISAAINETIKVLEAKRKKKKAQKAKYCDMARKNANKKNKKAKNNKKKENK